MKDTIRKNSYNHGGGSSNGNGYHNRKSSGESKPKYNDYCWSFNCGKCKWGSRCDWINRCSFCDHPSHGANTCRKKEKKEKDHREKRNDGKSES